VIDEAPAEPSAETPSGAATEAPPAPPAGSPTATAVPLRGPDPGPIVPGDTLAIAGRKAMRLQLTRLLSREPALRDGGVPDDLRRYRVAIRRLRAAMRTFRGGYDRREIRSLRTALRQLAVSVGRVRDLDVRIADLDRWATERGADAALAVSPLRAAWTDERGRAAAALDQQLHARRHGRLLVSLSGFVDRSPAHRAAPRQAPDTVRDRVASLVWDAYERVRAYGGVVRSADLPTLHRLRIEAKRLRYSIEFLADVLGPDAPHLVERLVALQDHLGALNDASLTAAAARAFLEARQAELEPGTRAAIAAYLADRERESARLRRSVGRVWRPLAGITFARRLGQTVVLA
jgi:CHAD domain-containing protein